VLRSAVKQNASQKGMYQISVMPFLEEEQPENYQNMLFWQKLYVIPQF